MMGWYGADMGWAGWLLMSLTVLAFWALVILAGVGLLGGNSLRPGSNLLAPRDARSILDGRFASGDLEAEMKKGPVEPGPSSVRGGT